MRIILAILLILVLIVVGWALFFREAAPPQAPEPEPEITSSVPVDEQSPGGTVVRLLDAVRDFDVEQMRACVTNPGSVSVGSGDSGAELVRGFTSRMRYTVTAERIDGDTAEVDVSVTAADLGKTISDLIAEATKYAAGRAIRGEAVDMEGFMREYVESIDYSQLGAVTSTPTVTLRRQSGGAWLVDNQEEANAALVDAITGGALEKIKSLAETAKKFGVTIGGLSL